MKMRAALSHQFGRVLGRGTQLWDESPHTPGTYIGNPSLSTKVSQYMVALRRRKVSSSFIIYFPSANTSPQFRSGEVVTSACAMDEGTMKALWEFNNKFEAQDCTPVSRKTKENSPESWGGGAIRCMLNLLYILSFLCLLRFDEALRIQWHWLTMEDYNGLKRLKISLPYRKTHQYGGE
jgi:hypothetical protein